MKAAGALAAVAMCSACGGPASAPSATALDVRYVGRTLSVDGRLVTAARVNSNPLPRYAALVPDRRARLTTHEYIINNYGTYAGIFNYPKGDRQIGTIDNVGGQGCTNVLYGYGKKIFWIVAGADQITEYEVPKKPLKTLSVASGQPSSCAMDMSGDLAVGNLANGNVIIFTNATGTGTVYTTPLTAEFFDGYDPNGNLFADGFTPGSYNFELIELPKDSSTFEKITTSNVVKFPGSVQWDGAYLAVTDQQANAIYRYAIHGTKATLKATVSLTGAGGCAQNWIGKGVVFCADAGNSDGEVFKYPAGGSPIAVFTGNFDLPLGTVAANK